MGKYLMVLLALVFTTASCANPPKRPEMSVPMKLEGQSVALLRYDSDDNDWSAYCSGAWVSEKVFITAYHCSAAAMVMSLPEDDRSAAHRLQNELNSIGAPVYYGVKHSYNGMLHQGAMEWFQARVVAGDSERDLALVEVEGYVPPHLISPIADFEPAVGDDVESMGNPVGVEYSYARGYVSAYRTGLNSESFHMKGPFMQVNMAITSGNSGGGIFNNRGELVGVVSFINGELPGHGFTVPLGTIKRILETYKNSKKNDAVSASITKPSH